MPKFRTTKRVRATYIYYDAYGNKAAVLRPGEGGVTQDMIDALHTEDDAEHNAANKDSYYGLLHYESSKGASGDVPDDWRSEDLADHNANPETLLINTFTAAERSGAFKSAWDGLAEKQRDLVMKKLRGHKNVDIAREERITEGAVRHRLAKIRKIFQLFLT